MVLTIHLYIDNKYVWVSVYKTYKYVSVPDFVRA